MALEMRNVCEHCDVALGWKSEAYICSHECTFCPGCAAAMNFTCPNCNGEQVRRPRRQVATP